MDRVQYIQDFASRGDSFESGSFLNAFIRCLTFDEAVQVLDRSLEGVTVLRAPALRKICGEIRQQRAECAALIAELKEKISTGEPRRRSGYAFCLLEIAKEANDLLKNDVQSFLSESKYVGLRRRGYKLYSPERPASRELLERSWEKFQDSEAAWLIVKTFPAAYLVENRCNFIAAFNEGWQVSKLYLRLTEIDASYVNELLDIDPITYLYVQAKVGGYVGSDLVASIYLNHLGDERLGLLLWCLGELKQWDHLVALLNRQTELAQLRLSALHSFD